MYAHSAIARRIDELLTGIRDMFKGTIKDMDSVLPANGEVVPIEVDGGSGSLMYMARRHMLTLRLLPILSNVRVSVGQKRPMCTDMVHTWLVREYAGGFTPIPTDKDDAYACTRMVSFAVMYVIAAYAGAGQDVEQAAEDSHIAGMADPTEPVAGWTYVNFDKLLYLLCVGMGPTGGEEPAPSLEESMWETMTGELRDSAMCTKASILRIILTFALVEREHVVDLAMLPRLLELLGCVPKDRYKMLRKWAVDAMDDDVACWDEARPIDRKALHDLYAMVSSRDMYPRAESVCTVLQGVWLREEHPSEACQYTAATWGNATLGRDPVQHAGRWGKPASVARPITTAESEVVLARMRAMSPSEESLRRYCLEMTEAVLVTYVVRFFETLRYVGGVSTPPREDVETHFRMGGRRKRSRENESLARRRRRDAAHLVVCKEWGCTDFPVQAGYVRSNLTGGCDPYVPLRSSFPVHKSMLAHLSTELEVLSPMAVC